MAKKAFFYNISRCMRLKSSPYMAKINTLDSGSNNEYFIT